MGKEISLIAFLDEVVSRNTQHYRKDFELDAQKLRDALNSPYMDERIFYFMSRPNGTWCVLERDVFLRDSDGYKIWTHYADMPNGIEAYRVTITGPVSYTHLWLAPPSAPSPTAAMCSRVRSLGLLVST